MGYSSDKMSFLVILVIISDILIFGPIFGQFFSGIKCPFFRIKVMDWGRNKISIMSTFNRPDKFKINKYYDPFVKNYRF